MDNSVALSQMLLNDQLLLYASYTIYSETEVDTMDAMFITDLGASYPVMTRDGINVRAVGRVSNLFDSEYTV